jgi:hypothetical protein
LCFFERLSKSNASRDSTNSDSSNNNVLNNEHGQHENANDSQFNNSAPVNSDLTSMSVREDLNATEEREQANIELEDEDEADAEEYDAHEEEDEDVNDEEDEEYYDDEDAVMTKKNLFDIYNEYGNELLVESENSTGEVVSNIVAAVKDKRKYTATESTETSSDTSSSGASSAAQNSGSGSSGKVDDAMSCKNNLELLTKELNKMLDDIETQKFIINDKEIYFLNRIQNFRLLEQIKEEDDELNDGKLTI